MKYQNARIFRRLGYEKYIQLVSYNYGAMLQNTGHINDPKVGLKKFQYVFRFEIEDMKETFIVVIPKGETRIYFIDVEDFEHYKKSDCGFWYVMALVGEMIGNLRAIFEYGIIKLISLGLKTFFGVELPDYVIKETINAFTLGLWNLIFGKKKEEIAYRSQDSSLEHSMTPEQVAEYNKHTMEVTPLYLYVYYYPYNMTKKLVTTVNK